MAAITGEDFVGALTVTSLQNIINTNTNTGSAGFDVSGYTGKLSVIMYAGNGASGTVIVPSIKAGQDTNITNATNWVVNGTNFGAPADIQVLNVDLRSSTWGATSNAAGSVFTNKYMYLTWLITGSAVANSAFGAIVVGQKKISS